MVLKKGLALSALLPCSALASSVIINDAAYSSSYYFGNQAPTTQETHVIGVYETRSDHSFGYHPEGTAFVSVTGSASQPVNLVLSSYEPTNWVMEGDGLGFVGSVLINGYSLSRVTGFDLASVVNRSGVGNYFSACGYGNDSGGCNTPALINGVEQFYGEQITTFSGTYRATSFSIALSPVPEPDTGLLMCFGLAATFLQVLRKTAKATLA